jgi:transketolase
MGNIDGLFSAFGWHSMLIDGHSVDEIRDTVTEAVARKDGIPSCIVLNTVKGKGWSRTEGKTGIHHIAITDEMMAEAEKEFAVILGGKV